MTKINLLINRRARHLQHDRRVAFQVLILIGLFGIFIVFGGFIWVSQNQYLSQLEHALHIKQAEMLALAGMDSEAKKFDDRRKSLIQQHEMLQKLIVQRSYPSLLLEFVTDRLDPLNLWLEELKVMESDVIIQGMSLSQGEVFQFVQALNQTALFQKANVVEIRSTVYQNMALYHFTLALVMKGNFQYDARNL